MKLSRERIVEAALALVDAEGWEAVSMRRLAQVLDVWPMAVYRYFRDKEELMGAVVDAAAERVEVPARQGGWREQIADLLRSTRSAFPPGSGGGVDRALLSPGGLRMSEAGLGILHRAGLPPAEAARAWIALFAYAVGAASADEHGASASARTAVAALDEAEYPALTAASAHLAAATSEPERFEYGLERLLDGIAARRPGG